MTGKHAHEDLALTALCDELTARGRAAKLISHPDRDGDDPQLTVDALMDVNGILWAVDHCLVSRSPELPAAMRDGEKALRRPLEAVAESTHTSLAVQYQPQAGTTRADKRRGAAYYQAVIQLAQRACNTAVPVAAADGVVMIQGWPDWQPKVYLQAVADLTGNIFLGTQIEAGLKAALTKKLTGQLKRAKDAGYKTALLLDQTPRPGTQSMPIRIASPAGIAAVVQRILDQHPSVVDQVWLQSGETVPRFVAPQLHLLIAT
jgi:hypothetical protein